MGFNPFKEIKRAVKKTVKEFDRALDRRVGIDDPTIRAVTLTVGGAALGGFGAATPFGIAAGAIAGGALTLSALSEASKTVDTVKQPSFDPFAVDNSAVIGASEALRKRLANKRGLSSTNATGGLKSAAPGTKPTLFTFA